MSRRITGRIDGLDAWRSILMLGGPLLHGSMLHDPHLLFQIIDLVSGSFRMGAFFSISGLLAGLNLRRRAPRAWLARHAIRVGVPALFGIAVLCPIASLALRSGLPAPAASKILLFDWHHLWFLYALLFYGGLTYLAFTRIDRRRLVGTLSVARSIGQGRVLLYLSAAGFLLMFATALLIIQVVPGRYLGTAGQVPIIAAYVPLYGFGVLMAFSRSLRGEMLGHWRLPAGILTGAACGYLLWYTEIRLLLTPEAFGSWDAIVRYAGATVCPPAASLLILRSALLVRRIWPWIHQICAASLTLYLLHFPMLAVVNAVFLRFGWHYLVEYSVAVSATTAVCLIFHFAVVQHSGWLRFLLNGQAIDRAAGRTKQPGRVSAVN